MLEISLGPALIPRKFIIQGGRRFLITVRQRWLKPDFVTGAAQERRFYKIMTHDWPAPDSKPGEFAQPAVSHKRCRSDNRVMPPEYRISKLDRGKPCGEQRGVQTAGKLLNPGEGRTAVNNGGCALQDAHAGLPVHQTHHSLDGRARQETVGIQYHHVVVLTPPSAQKIRHITAFEIEVNPTPAIKQLTFRAQLLYQPRPDRLLLQPYFRVLAV